MKLYIGADHNGFKLKQSLSDHLRRAGHEVVDEGDAVYNPDDDFPQYGAKVAAAVLASEDSDARGILLCGSGQGVCIAANRFKGIRACLAWNRNQARASRNDDDCNILCLPARELNAQDMTQLVDTWLTTPFAGAPRYIRRNKQLDELG